MKVNVVTPLRSPHDRRMFLLRGEDTRENVMAFLGEKNYRFAIQQGWVVEPKPSVILNNADA